MTAEIHDTETLDRSKRIASNTLVLFLRMLAIMAINLYAVRVVLNALGEVDYGIFNAIAGVVLTSSFINTTLAVSFQRFYSYAIGKKQHKQLRQIFSSSANIVIVISLIVVFLFETIGLWFVVNHMMEPDGKFPLERLQATLWIFQFALFSFIFTLLQLPYTAAIFAHEDMGIFALLSLVECVGRLVVAMLIGSVLSDRLIFYGAGLLGVSMSIFLLYALIGRYRYEECSYQRVTEKKIYRELLTFSGWAMYGTLAGVGIVQGTNILLALFFGPIAVASYAIANQIYNATNSLCNSIVVPFRPAMVKAYAEEHSHYLSLLFNSSNKFIVYLLLCVTLPLISEMRTVLDWWLTDVNNDMVVYSRLMLIIILILGMQYPITTIIQSTGNIKRYYLTVDTMTLCSIPLTVLFFHMGLPAYWAFISIIIVCTVAHVLRLYCLKRSLPAFSYWHYAKSIILPALFITLLSAAFAFVLHNSIIAIVPRFVTVVLATPALVLLLVYAVGLTSNEKHLLFSFIRQIIQR